MRIERASFGAQAYSRSLFRELYRDCGRLFFVARRAGRIVGYVVGCAGEGSAEVISIAVLPEERQARAGTALMDRLLKALRGRGIAQVELMVRTKNRPALRFYRAFGFRRVGRVPHYYEDGADAYVMKRTV